YLDLPCSFSLLPPPPSSTLFPYTTLFRSPDRVIVTEGDPLGTQTADLLMKARLIDAKAIKGKVKALEAVAQAFLRGNSFCGPDRSEEHTSELQSRSDLVCRLLLEKKKQTL